MRLLDENDVQAAIAVEVGEGNGGANLIEVIAIWDQNRMALEGEFLAPQIFEPKDWLFTLRGCEHIDIPIAVKIEWLCNERVADRQ